MRSVRVRSVKEWFLVLLVVSSASASMTAGAESISVQSVQGVGEFTGAVALLGDGRMPPEESSFDDPNCVYWSEQNTHFVLDLGKSFRITGLTLQADNNDDYIVETSADGQVWTALLTVSGKAGEIDFGMDTLSSLQGDPEWVTSLVITPVEAHYLKLSAKGGDEMYAASELLVYGEPVQVELESQTSAVVALDATLPPATPIDLTKPLKVKSVKGFGQFSHAAKLLIDRKMPKQETNYDNRACVFWSDPNTYFVIDLGEVFWIIGLTIQADNNDDYVIQVSVDGKAFVPLLTIGTEWGEINDGMDTLSTLTKDTQYLPEMAIKPSQVRYVKLGAKGGDGAYSISELLLYGSKTAPILSPAVSSQPPKGPAGPAGDVKGDMEKIFDAMDTNKDGKVSKDEYASLWRDKLDVDKNFAFFDKDGSGYIEKTEYLGLSDKVKRGTGQDHPNPPAQSEEGSTRLDPILVQKAIDALPKWSEINQLMLAGRFADANRIVKNTGFENWSDLNFYYSTVCTLGQAIQENLGARDSFAPVFGRAAVEVIAQPENLARIKANNPNQP